MTQEALSMADGHTKTPGRDSEAQRGAEGEVTAADRGRAVAALAAGRADEMFRTYDTVGLVERIAAALAKERAKARAPFLRIADEYAHRAVETNGWSITFRDQIRRAAEEQQ